MGTHPSAPARVGQRLLSEVLQSSPGLVGLVPSEYDPDDLPFLFKVLSIKTALSIQVSEYFYCGSLLLR
jgi:mannose-6-phosphate isomerase